MEIISPKRDQITINYRLSDSIHRSDSKRSSRILIEQEINSCDISLIRKGNTPRYIPFMPQTEDPLEDELFHKLFR